MTTNFFSHICSMNMQGTWVITITKTAEDNLAVIVLLRDEDCSDPAAHEIAPAILKGSPQEIDDTFFPELQAPFEVTSGIFSNMKEYMRQQETALAQSKMEKEKNSKEEKELSEKEKKFKKVMDTVEALKKEGKNKEAYVKVPDPSDYPKHADDLRVLKESLAKTFAPDLFS